MRLASIIVGHFQTTDDEIQTLLVMRGQRLKLEADSLRSGPTNHGLLDQERHVLAGNVQPEVHHHAGRNVGEALETAAFAGEIQRSDRMFGIPAHQGSRERDRKPRALPRHHVECSPDQLMCGESAMQRRCPSSTNKFCGFRGFCACHDGPTRSFLSISEGIP